MNDTVKLPEWFKGELYKEGGVVTNPYSGAECELSAVELSMYDFVKGSEMLISNGIGVESLIDDFYKGISWFKEHSNESYFILLD